MSATSPIVSAGPSSLLSGYSLEMTTKDVASLEAAEALIPQRTSISVTFLPGEHIETQLAAAAAVKRLGFVPVAHISARRLRHTEELEHILWRLRTNLAVDRCFVVAGDPVEPTGPYTDALAVISSGLLEHHGLRTVGIGGYPQGHPHIDDDKLWQALLDKTAALQSAGLGCEIVTQFGFDAHPVLGWLERVRAAGIDAPVRIGVPGPARVKTLLRFAGRCGVAASTSVLKKYGISVTRLLSISGPDRLLAELAEGFDPAVHGEVRIHLYPFGGLRETAEWAAAVMS